jgi:rhodanese-related sulfurtransferase
VNSVEWWSMNYEKAFAIVGLRTSEEADIGSKPEAIAVEKVVWTREVAESEVSRLNRLNAGKKGVVYFWTLTRVEQR